jgi:ketosteroid isomerase-like protein
MKATLAVFLLTVSSAAQMTNAGLLKLDREFAQATTKEHLNGWMNYMMDSTVIFAPQHYSGNLDGKEAIRSRYRDLFTMSDFKMDWTPMSAQILPSTATGYTKGTFHWVIPNSPCKCVNDWHGTYLAVWEEENSAAGKWKHKALLPSLDATSLSCGCGS